MSVAMVGGLALQKFEYSDVGNDPLGGIKARPITAGRMALSTGPKTGRTKVLLISSTIGPSATAHNSVLADPITTDLFGSTKGTGGAAPLHG